MPSSVTEDGVKSPDTRPGVTGPSPEGSCPAETPAERREESKLRKWVGYLLKYGVPLLITVLLCRLLLKGIDWNEMMDVIRGQCDFRWIALALFISIFSHVFRAMRWRIQLRALDIDAPLFTLVLSIFGTYAVNLVLPRLGEIWRSGYVAKREDAPFSAVFGSMVADRLADTVTVALLTLVTFILATTQLETYMGGNSETLSRYAALLASPWLWCAVVAMIVLAVLFFCWKTENKIVCRIQKFCAGLWHGFAVIARMKGKGRWLLLTVCIWGCYFFQLYVAFFAFPFTADVVTRYGILAVLVTFVLSSLSMGVPSNGGIGPWQWSVKIALTTFYGVAVVPALAFANLVMGMQTLLLIVLGVFTFACIAFQNKKMRRAAVR